MPAAHGPARATPPAGPSFAACVQLVLLRRRLWILHTQQSAWKRSDVANKELARKMEWLANRKRYGST